MVRQSPGSETCLVNKWLCAWFCNRKPYLLRLTALAVVAQLRSMLLTLGINVPITLPEEVGIAIALFAIIVLTNILKTRLS